MHDTARVIAVCTSPGGLPKFPRDGMVCVGTLGLEEDRQRDRKRHGGPDQAVCVYLISDYEGFAAEGLEIAGPGAFGENLTLDTDPASVHIGDRWRVRGLSLEVTQPRLPCANLQVYGVDLPQRIRETGRTGFYCRVLTPGRIAAGDSLDLERRGSVSLDRTLRAWWSDRHGSSAEDRAAVAEVLAEPALSRSWRIRLEKSLQS